MANPKKKTKTSCANQVGRHGVWKTKPGKPLISPHTRWTLTHSAVPFIALDSFGTSPTWKPPIYQLCRYCGPPTCFDNKQTPWKGRLVSMAMILGWYGSCSTCRLYTYSVKTNAHSRQWSTRLYSYQIGPTKFAADWTIAFQIFAASPIDSLCILLYPIHEMRVYSVSLIILLCCLLCTSSPISEAGCSPETAGKRVEWWEIHNFIMTCKRVSMAYG